MNISKLRLALFAALAFATGFLAGCSTAGSVQKADVGLVQKVLDDMLPPDFTGPVSAVHHNQYFDIAISAGGVRKVDGRWTWDWLQYERTSHFPVFAGVQWGSTGKVMLGIPPPK